MEKREYEIMSVEQLRKEACNRQIGAATWRATARKSELVNALHSGYHSAPTQQTQSLPMAAAPNQLHGSTPQGTPEAKILAALKEMLPSAAIDTAHLDKIRQRIQTLENNKPRSIEIKTSNLPPVTFKTAHASLEKLIRALASKQTNQRRVNILMVGASGTGKTHGAEQAAKALALDYYAISVGPQTTMSHLMGYKDAHGTYQRTLFREAVERGGVFLFDEFDAGDASVITCINAATSNSMVAFPDGMIAVHADFVCIAAANTFGRGADRQYVGRNQLDAATMARFVTLAWDYDEKLEKSLSTNPAWLDRVHEIRKKVDEARVRVVVSTRAIMQGDAMLAAGFPQAEVEEMTIFKGLDNSTRTKIM